AGLVPALTRDRLRHQVPQDPSGTDARAVGIAAVGDACFDEDGIDAGPRGTEYIGDDLVTDHHDAASIDTAHTRQRGIEDWRVRLAQRFDPDATFRIAQAHHGLEERREPAGRDRERIGVGRIDDVWIRKDEAHGPSGAKLIENQRHDAVDSLE